MNYFKNKEVIILKEGEASVVQWLTLVVMIITTGIALWIGFNQNSINQKIKDVQDTAEIFAYAISGAPNTNQPIKGYPWLLRLVNVGNVQLYITNYSINGSKIALNNALLPAGQQQNAWYQIILPLPVSITSTIPVIINATDKFQRLWQSEINIEYKNNEWESTTQEIKEITN